MRRYIRFVAPVVALLAVLMSTAPALAAMNGYLTLVGAQQGAIKGGVTQAGKQDTILVRGYEVVSLSAASTAPNPRTLVLRKEVDLASPRLLNAMASHENLTTFKLRLYRPDPRGTGTEDQYFTIDLTNVTVTRIHQTFPMNTDATQANAPIYEEVSFSFQQMQWTWTQGGITAVLN